MKLCLVNSTNPTEIAQSRGRIRHDVDLLVVRTNSNKLPKTKLKSKSIVKNTIELTFEVELKDDDTKILDDFKDIDGVVSASVISYQNDFGA